MSAKKYDVLVVGARCAGSPTAMLLAQKGYRVCMVDRATFPSDTLSTHIVQPRGVAALSRWGLLDRLRGTGCPPVRTYAFDFGEAVISGTPGQPACPESFCPRRIVLDKLLVDAAVNAGVDVCEGFMVSDVVVDRGRVTGIKGHARGGSPVSLDADVVIGADGRHSVVAKAVQAPTYHEKPRLLAVYYSYWDGLPMHGRFETYIRPHRGFAAVPTNDGLTLVLAGWPYAEFEANKKDVEAHFWKTLDLVPAFATRARDAKRVAPLAGAAVPNFFRTPYGPGWALVGDAGYTKDPITGQGIMDAFLDAERCAAALDAALSGSRPFDDALEQYQRERDEDCLAMYELTCRLATLEPPPPEMMHLFMEMRGDQMLMDLFAQMHAGTISPPAFFAKEGVAKIMASGRDAS